MSLIFAPFRIAMEYLGKKHTLEEWQTALAVAGETANGRFQASSDTEKHRTTARHIIGIESWGQSRLQVFLGEPLVMDDYDDYRPAPELDMVALSQLFDDTRKETVSLARKLQEAGLSDTETVSHNALGDLTVRGWLAYFNTHAGRESRGL